jgi:hypothetical protein
MQRFKCFLPVQDIQPLCKAGSLPPHAVRVGTGLSVQNVIYIFADLWQLFTNFLFITELKLFNHDCF